ncbi:MAG: hypothetical protein SV429_11425 [Pseudomonadota bacterium]|nr:hypothetical protein [Pseudomonadota bacterium]
MMHDDHARYQYVTTIRHSFTERIGTFLVETAGKTGADLFSGSRPTRLPGLNPDTSTVFYLIDEFVATSQFVATDCRANQLI